MVFCFFFQAEDGIRDLVRSRGLGDVYKRQIQEFDARDMFSEVLKSRTDDEIEEYFTAGTPATTCLLYTSDAADERSSVDLGGRRLIKQKTTQHTQHIDKHINRRMSSEHKQSHSHEISVEKITNT